MRAAYARIPGHRLQNLVLLNNEILGLQQLNDEIMPINLFEMPKMRAMPKMSNEVPKFCEDLNTITLDNKGGEAHKFIDGVNVTDGRNLGIMSSST